MAMWRCPHCGTPQAETARCWVCRRSSTACGSCRHFRRSVAAQLGYCGLDPRRSALRGDEIRACWEAAPAAAGTEEPGLPRPGPVAPAAATDRTSVRRLEFVPVEPAATPSATPGRARRPARRAEEPPVPAEPLAPGSVIPEARWSLWGDVEA